QRRTRRTSVRRVPGCTGRTDDRPRESALGELEATAGTALAVLLTLLHAAVAGEEAGVAQRDLQALVVMGEGAAQAHHDRAALARRATAGGVHQHVHLAAGVGRLQRADAGLAVAPV